MFALVQILWSLLSQFNYSVKTLQEKREKYETHVVCLSCLSTKKNAISQGFTSCASMAAWLWENGERMRKWRGNGERMRKWTQNEQIERDSLSTFPHFLFITSLSIHFLSKIVHFYREMLNTALLSWKSQTTQHTLYEKIILGRIRCEKAPQVVISWIPNRDINS